jgi:hypothetical protein
MAMRTKVRAGRAMMEALESRVLLTAAGVATRLVVTQQATNLVAGADISTIAVAVEDSKGNVVVDGSSVTLAISKGPTGATLGGLTTVPTVEGVATFTGLSAFKAGTYALVATDGTLKPANLNKFTVSAGTASMLGFTVQPKNSTGRTAIGTIEVAVEDPFGNVVTGDNSKVALGLASSPAGATLGGDTIENAKKGVAVFKGATLTASGTYTLSASDGDLTGATSNSFTVSASATQLVFSHTPTTTLGNTPMTVVVTLEDATGHVATGDNSNVTLKLASGPGAKLSGTLTVAAVAGVATFTNVRAQLGEYAFFASDKSLKSAASSLVSVVAGNPVALRILSTSVEGTSRNALAVGTVGPITVAVVDSHNNIVSSPTVKDPSGATVNGSTMTLVLNTTLETQPITGTPSQAQTATATVTDGVATFTGLTSEPSGRYLLVLSDGGLIGASLLLAVR